MIFMFFVVFPQNKQQSILDRLKKFGYSMVSIPFVPFCAAALVEDGNHDVKDNNKDASLDHVRERWDRRLDEELAAVKAQPRENVVFVNRFCSSFVDERDLFVGLFSTREFSD